MYWLIYMDMDVWVLDRMHFLVDIGIIECTNIVRLTASCRELRILSNEMLEYMRPELVLHRNMY